MQRAVGIGLALLLVGTLVVGGILLSLVGVIDALFFGAPAQVTQCANTPACQIVFAATTLEHHLSGVNQNQYLASVGVGQRGGATRDPFLQPIFDYWQQVCGGYVCSDIDPQGIQCVTFIKGVFYLAHEPVTDHPDAFQWWADYANKPGWAEIPSAAAPPDQRGLPQPGDIVIWNHGPFGHIAIVIDVGQPAGTRNGWLTVAQGNGPGNTPNWDPTWPGNFYKMPIFSDLSVGTWSGYQVWGYIRQTRPQTPMPTNLASSLYVKTATDDAAAMGIPPAWYTEQLQVESQYNPQFNANGREGIGGFPSALAASLGVDPYDPDTSLQTLAKLVAAYTNSSYGGDYAAALAAYAQDQPSVQQCKTGHDPAWLACMPQAVQQYVLEIIYYP